MRKLYRIAAWRHSDRGATAVEYGLIAAGIAVVISAGVFLFGSSLGDLFSNSSALVSVRP